MSLRSPMPAQKLIACLKQAQEFGIGQDGKQRLASMICFITDIQGMGLPVAKGLALTETFYWDLNDRTVPSPTGYVRSLRPAPFRT